MDDYLSMDKNSEINPEKDIEIENDDSDSNPEKDIEFDVENSYELDKPCSFGYKSKDNVPDPEPVKPKKKTKKVTWKNLQNSYSEEEEFSKELEILEGVDTTEEMRIISYSEESSSELNN